MPELTKNWRIFTFVTRRLASAREIVYSTIKKEIPSPLSPRFSGRRMRHCKKEDTPMAFVEFEQRGHVGLITINRPEVLNALNLEVIEQLPDAPSWPVPTSARWSTIPPTTPSASAIMETIP